MIINMQLESVLVITAFSSCSRAEARWLPGAMAGDPRQLWLGNIPGELQEPEVVDVLASYGVRPYKVVLRQRQGQDCKCMSSFMYDRVDISPSSLYIPTYT